MDNQRLASFATAVGTDIKNLNTAVDTKVTLAEVQSEISNATNGAITAQEVTRLVNDAKAELKAEILGDGVPEELNTLKEIAEKISDINSDTADGVVSKLAELGSRIDSIEGTDLVAVYVAAKNG